MSDAVEQLLQQGHQARREDRLNDAKRDFTEAVEIARKAGGSSDLARALTGLGQIERDLGNTELALQLYQEATIICRKEADPLRLAHTVRHAGDIHRKLRQLDLAEPCYREALKIYRAHPEAPQLDLANAIRGLALLKSDAGKRNEARALWQEARDLYAAANVETGVTESTRRLTLLEEEQR